MLRPSAGLPNRLSLEDLRYAGRPAPGLPELMRGICACLAAVAGWCVCLRSSNISARWLHSRTASVYPWCGPDAIMNVHAPSSSMLCSLRVCDPEPRACMYITTLHGVLQYTPYITPHDMRHSMEAPSLGPPAAACTLPCERPRPPAGSAARSSAQHGNFCRFAACVQPPPPPQMLHTCMSHSVLAPGSLAGCQTSLRATWSQSGLRPFAGHTSMGFMYGVLKRGMA